MKKLAYALLIIMHLSLFGFAQTGHIMQGAGAVNMSMGGASTAQPIDINGALLWNPASISDFSQNIFSINAGAFFSSPEVSSSLPAGMMGPGSPAVSGTTKDSRGTSVMPALSMVFARKESRHAFGIAAHGVSGFGVTFEEESNNPLNPNFDPTKPSNPINYPQQVGGFGYIESDYMLLQISVAYAYKLTDKVSLGLQPTFNYANLELNPNPLASPDQALGYPKSDRAAATGIGGQIGIFYDSKEGFKFGVAYKSPQYFGEFELENTYLEGSSAPDNKFRMDFPAILSLGTGYSTKTLDLAMDLRQVFYESAEGFAQKGWTPTGAVKGFGWKDITVVSFGLQYKGLERLPLRIGYTYSTNPVDEEIAFFSVPATAIIRNAFQVGAGYHISERFTLNATYHFGTSAGSTNGLLLSPMAVNAENPYGELPGTSVSYSMTTSMIMAGINYTFLK